MRNPSVVALSKDYSEDPTSNHHVLREMAKTRRVLWLNSLGTRTPKLGNARDLGKLRRKLTEFAKGPIEVEPNLPLVPMDFVLIAQVLTNLLENAVAYSPPGSPVEVRASRQESCLLIEVRDRGMGLPSTDVESLFDSFVRGHAPGVGGGTGLGLSICRGLVEAHHGRISARARSDGGAVFFFTLPLEACYAS